MARFDDCLHLILNFEGGFSDDPADPGGATNLGIIQTEYDRYRDSIRQPRQSVRGILESEARAIYLASYWTPTHADYLAAPLDVVIFDTAVNNGTGTAIKWLQLALHVPATGTFDTATSIAYHAVHADNIPLLASQLLDERVARYHALGDHGRLNRFLKGWLNRVASLKKWAGMS